jgi:hypothetical protein
MLTKIQCKVPVVFLKEGETFVAHCPVLDLSSCGSTFDEAAKNFDEIMDIFLEECLEKGTLATVLESCGWQSKGEKSKRQFSPPHYVGERQVSMTVPCMA